jgi:uncharacterized protein
MIQRSSLLFALLLGSGFGGLSPSGGAAQIRTEGDDPSVVIATGIGRVEVAPDRARIAFAVETEAPTAREAGEANALLMEAVIAAVRATRVPGLRVQSSGYSLSPRYRTRSDDRAQEIAGYSAQNQVLVIVDAVEPVGQIVDAALGAGANRVAGLSFEVRDPEPHQREALRIAVEKARGEAEVMATALGMQLGLPLHVQGGADTPFPRFSEVRMDRVAFAQEVGAVTPVEAGLQTLSAQVTVRFRILEP